MSNLLKTTLLFCASIFCSVSLAQQQDQVLSPYFLVKSDNPNVDQLPLKKNVGRRSNSRRHSRCHYQSDLQK